MDCGDHSQMTMRATRTVLWLCVALSAACADGTATTPEPVSAPAPSTSEGAETPSQVTGIVKLPPHRTQGVRRKPHPAEQALLDDLMRTAEEVRELRFTRPVEVQIEDSVAIAESLLSQITDEDVQEAKSLYTALGLLRPEVNLRRLFEEVLGEQVLGYYDPKAGRMVVRDDVVASLASGGEAGSQTKLVLIHELVHALQGQRLGLDQNHDKKRDTDADNAYRALVEGDATLAMLGHHARAQGLPMSMITASLASTGAMLDTDALMSGEKLKDAPAILRVTLVAPYLRGLQLMASVYNRGGWKAVNRAHRRPPTTTEQVLHPEKFLRHERAVRIKMPRLNALHAAGFRKVHEDTIGELELGVYLGQKSASQVDDVAAAGWGGDRLRIYKRKKRRAVIWFTVWDTVQDAKEASLAAVRVSPERPSFLVERRGKAVLIVRNLPPKLLKSVQGSFRRFVNRLSATKAKSAAR